ncbi:MAG: histidine kinase [Betaproteobacteria bacterium]|nr:histidine kinase [Betaproteobacteria bacterium]
MASIKQNSVTPTAAATPQPVVTLPDFCNLGIMLRILLIVDGMSAVAAMLKAPTLAAAWQELIELSALVQPLLLLSLLILCLGRKTLARLPYRSGVIAVLAVELLLVTLTHAFSQRFFYADLGGLPRLWLFMLLTSGVLLGYFHLRSRAFSPAISEARLQALQARIRPHFLFNSINAVLSLIRSDPKGAERALEDMADLFRVLMADNRQLAPLEREVALCRQYLDLEHLRLGERLQVVWHVDNMPGDALIPPLVLQPLLENAVYHGIEPATEPGEIVINIYRARNQVHLVLTNPYPTQGSHHAGNKMALANIKERLELHFDAEASLITQIGDNRYQVHIVVPYMSEKND